MSWRIVLAALALPGIVGAQGLRISGVTTMQFVELRPLEIDSIPLASVPGAGEWRTAADGVPAICAPGSNYCQVEQSGSRVSALPVLQDITVAGWGWVQGLSFHGDFRARTQFGGDSAFLFPRAGDHFDVVDGYAQLDRASWSGRLGRQWVTGGLGAYAFDGGDAVWHGEAFTFEGWTGRALVGGLDEPYTSAQLAAVDDLAPQQTGYVFGARARYRPDALSAASLTYQRILVADRSGLYSERLALDGSTRRFGIALDGSGTYDFATGAWDEGLLRASTGGERTVGYSVELRHSRPYFELWTIWGAFSPVGFDEERATIDWHPHASQFSYAFHGAYRKYAETNAGISLRTDGWRAGADVSWRGQGTVSASGSYDVDIGSGAASTDARAGLRWNPASDVSFGADASVTQSIYEFRVGTGRIYGLAGDVAKPVRPDVELTADLGIYQHVLTDGAPGPNWTQRRASVRLEWMLGRDPGMPDKGP
ncbi:MAG TPA: hypothetical protein VMH39_04940 [Gemmatimonadaceae bacterium]|nr:hypothetical protein [Gemmatimonadaceae bacterium]